MEAILKFNLPDDEHDTNMLFAGLDTPKSDKEVEERQKRYTEKQNAIQD